MRHEEVLSSRQCWDLLATATVGRLALSLNALPAIVPVQYYLDDQTIVMCLGGFDVPHHSAHDAIVAFSVDELDPQTWTGWSVQALGVSTFEYHDVGVPADCGEPRAGQIVRLEPKHIGGQLLHLCPFLTPM